MVAEEQWLRAVGEILAGSHIWQASQIAGIVDDALGKVGVRATIYLVDVEQCRLRPLASPGEIRTRSFSVDDSAPGEAFRLVKSVALDTGETGRDTYGWWVPMVNGTDRLGVVEFAAQAPMTATGEVVRQRCEMLAGLLGHLITTTSPRGDYLAHIRRSQPMTIASELLWHLLQPLTVVSDHLAIAAILQPCYDVGGDAYDYAIDGHVAHISVLDGTGKGLGAGLAAAVALSSLRAARRRGLDLGDQARWADEALLQEFSDSRFVTGVLIQLDLKSGVLRIVNAGHPAPLLLRSGSVLGELGGGRRMPLGLPDHDLEIAEHSLRPGDRILLYTDGITEARDQFGQLFGADRLTALAEQHATVGLPVAETVRRLSNAVIDHQEGPPADDATLLLADWSPAAARRMVPDSP
jgi:sigma-B regulation protein RsbU (phosphoserine phosphatase)